eukprot:340035-Pyramimonas_sp.AAC.1
MHGHNSAQIIQAELGSKFEAAVAKCQPSLKEVLTSQKSKWMAVEGAQVAQAFVTARHWSVAPLVPTSAAADIDEANRAWEAFLAKNPSDPAHALAAFNAVMEELADEAVATLPAWVGASDTKVCRESFLKPEYFARMLVEVGGVPCGRANVGGDAQAAPRKKAKVDAGVGSLIEAV